jgi:hypothetical protein
MRVSVAGWHTCAILAAAADSTMKFMKSMKVSVQPQQVRRYPQITQMTQMPIVARGARTARASSCAMGPRRSPWMPLLHPPWRRLRRAARVGRVVGLWAFGWPLGRT